MRLLSTLTDLLTQTRISVAVCLFIDGLDEFDGRYSAVIERINNLADQPFVKICLSSRPLLDFEKAFTNKPSLRLQDLTLESIRAYAVAQLVSPINQQAYYSEDDKDRVKDLVNSLARRAEGVFLWAVIAVRNLRDGLQDFVDLSELIREIKSLPAGVENLYSRILARIKPAYRRDASRFLQLVLYEDEYRLSSYSLDLCRLYFIDVDGVNEDQPLVYRKVDKSTLVEGCHSLKTRLLSHTLGLLDLTPPSTVKDAFSVEDVFDGNDFHHQILRTRVCVIHRTFSDYLRYNSAAKSFMKDAGSCEEHTRLSIARGAFFYLVFLLMRCNGELSAMSETQDQPLMQTMYQIQRVERILGAAPIEAHAIAAYLLFRAKRACHSKYPEDSLF
ncbi:MAG: hypothetical protein Q9167_002423 [Letrouitia subvulpina]